MNNILEDSLVYNKKASKNKNDNSYLNDSFHTITHKGNSFKNSIDYHCLPSNEFPIRPLKK